MTNWKKKINKNNNEIIIIQNKNKNTKMKTAKTKIINKLGRNNLLISHKIITWNCTVHSQ